jgi:hypothetical protein
MKAGSLPVGQGAHTAALLPALGSLEERWAKRRASRMPGLLSHASLVEALPCIVTDTSSTGARLDILQPRHGHGSQGYVSQPARLPVRFTLTLEGRTAVDCEVVWNEGSAFGVRFVSPTRSLPRVRAARVSKASKKAGLLTLLRLAR